MPLRYLELSFFIFLLICNNAIQFQDIIPLTTLFTFLKKLATIPQKTANCFLKYDINHTHPHKKQNSL